MLHHAIKGSSTQACYFSISLAIKEGESETVVKLTDKEVQDHKL
jgi:hypothetical protein